MRGAAACGGGGVDFDGALSASGTGSTTVTGTARNIVGSGTIKFINVSEGSGALEYNNHGGGWSSLAENTTVALTSGQTFQMRATGLPVDTSYTADITDNATGIVIQGISMSRGAS